MIETKFKKGIVQMWWEVYWGNEQIGGIAFYPSSLLTSEQSFDSGQTYLGIHGNFAGYVALYEHEFPKLGYSEMPDIDEAYGGITWFEDKAPNGWGVEGKQVLGWDYLHGKCGECNITLDDVYQDVLNVYINHDRVQKYINWK